MVFFFFAGTVCLYIFRIPHRTAQNPLGVDIVINLPQDGIRLIFDPIVQRLKAIEVFNMKLVKLKYG